jgi:hypothetical protein
MESNNVILYRRATIDHVPFHNWPAHDANDDSRFRLRETADHEVAPALVLRPTAALPRRRRRGQAPPLAPALCEPL